MKEHLKLLGFRVKDIVTGFEGIVETVGFDLYGCVQAIVKPDRNKKTGEIPTGQWFDVKRLKATSKAPVMKQPAFVEVPGGSERPGRIESPLR